MLTLISPAKSFSFDNNTSVLKSSKAYFTEEYSALIKQMQTFSAEDLCSLMKISPDLAKLNVKRYKNWNFSMNLDWRKGGQCVSQTFRYGESDLHTQRWIDKVHDLSDVSDVPQYIRDHADEYLSPDGEFFVLVGGPTEDLGGWQFTEDGITLHDGVFMPGVQGHYEDGKFVMERENLGDANTPLIRYQDFYGWSFMRNATFDADYIKLREISLAYRLPTIAGIQNASVSLYSRNIMLWTKAGINIDPETAFQPESGTQTSGIQFKQGIERYNVSPWTIPIGIKLNITF